jgi:GNAT superfamily N-acetyltransferase
VTVAVDVTAAAPCSSQCSWIENKRGRRPAPRGGLATRHNHRADCVTTTRDRPDLRFEARRYDDPDVVRLVAQIQQEYAARYGGVDTTAVDLNEFAQPLGLFFVGLLDGVTAAIGGWRRICGGAEHTVEIKRMYVVPAFRGRGLSRRMLAQLERSAADAGARRIVLITGDRHVEAIRLYESSGYKPTPGFGHYAGEPWAKFYGKAIYTSWNTARLKD